MVSIFVIYRNADSLKKKKIKASNGGGNAKLLLAYFY